MIQSVTRALQLLEALDSAWPGHVSLTELAAQTGLKAPTAHSLLHTLVAMGYVEHSTITRRYALGERACAIGHPRYAADVLAKAAAPYVDSLRRELNETVVVALYRAGQRQTVVTAESDEALRVGVDQGVDRSFYETATGRVLLAMLPPDELQRVVDSVGLPHGLWPGVRTRDQLDVALAGIRAEGHAYLERLPDGHVLAVAVPIPSDGRDVCAALGLYYPSVRAGEQRRETIVAALERTAVQTAAALALSG